MRYLPFPHPGVCSLARPRRSPSSACRGHLSRRPPLEIFPDMNRQPKLRPQKPFDFFTNGVSSQLPPAGTVAAQPASRDLERPGLCRFRIPR